MEILLRQEHRNAFLADLQDHVGEQGHDQGGQSFRRLVEEQHLWVRHQRPGDREHLLLPSGKL